VQCVTVCLCEGEVLPIHINISSPSQDSRQVEQGLLAMLKNVVGMISLTDLPDGLSDDQRDRAASLLTELQAVIIGAQFVHSILLFTYVSSVDVVDSVSAMLVSGQLSTVFQRLFRCLTRLDDLTITVSVKTEDVQYCRDAFAYVGKIVCVVL